MKYLLLSIIGLSFFLSGCYDEDKAEPSGDYSPVRFEFPQGDESWDKLFEKIYNDYGFCVIYKGFDAKDLNKNWIMTGSGNWTGHPVADEHMPKYEDLLKNYLVPFLGKKEVVEACSPLYLYLAEDLGGSLAAYGIGVGINLGGLDFWAIGLTDTIKLTPGIEDFRNGLVRFVYNKIVENAVLKGLVPEPNDFQSGIDYKTEVETTDPGDPNYYVTRGFVGCINYSGWESAYGCMFSWYDSWPFSGKKIDGIVTAQGGDFMIFSRAAMRWTKEEFEGKFPSEKYPLVNKRYNMVVEQFKKYGFDLPGFAKKVKELPTPW